MTTIAKMTALALGCSTLTLSGCATVPPGQNTWLDGTRWTIADVNGVSTAGRSDFTVSFSATRFEARFGCRRASGQYTLRPISESDPQPVFQGSDAVITGTACTGNFAETVGPEILSNATLSVTRKEDGTVVMLQPPTGIYLRPL